jgi:hypothetical protein
MRDHIPHRPAGAATACLPVRLAQPGTDTEHHFPFGPQGLDDRVAHGSLARFTELDEKFAFAAIADRLRAARDAGRLRVDDPDTLARLFLGALTRGSMLIAGSDRPKATRDAVARAVRALLQGLSA